jgi:hypothetical protein
MQQNKNIVYIGSNKCHFQIQKAPPDANEGIYFKY